MSFESEVQAAAEERLNACEEALEDDPCSTAYCGCTTCVVREVLTVTWDMMLEEARREVRNESPPRPQPPRRLTLVK